MTLRARPLRGDHPIFTLVGQIASEFSRAEHSLDVAIWQLAGLSGQTGACITAQLMGIRPRCLSILALAKKHELSEEMRKQVRRFMADSYKPTDDRNRIIHDCWYINTSNGTTSQLRAMPKDQPIYGHIPVSEEDCRQIYDRIHRFAKRAEELKGRLLAEFSSKQTSGGRQ